MARVNGAELLRQMRALAGTLTTTAERLTDTVADLGDTGAAEAEVEAVRKAAEKRAAADEADSERMPKARGSEAAQACPPRRRLVGRRARIRRGVEERAGRTATRGVAAAPPAWGRPVSVGVRPVHTQLTSWPLALPATLRGFRACSLILLAGSRSTAARSLCWCWSSARLLIRGLRLARVCGILLVSFHWPYRPLQ